MSEELARLEAMEEPDQETWDLSPNDVKAIRWAIEQIKVARTPGPATLAVVERFGKVVAGFEDHEHGELVDEMRLFLAEHGAAKAEGGRG